jgi:predicted metal-dependent HD superfamily phosphohydrolase
MIEKYFYAVINKFCKNTNLIKNNWEQIIEKYSEKHRYYHNFAHIENMFSKYIENISEMDNFNTVFLSILYHDVIYEPKNSDNEEKSALFAEKHLQEFGFTPIVIEKIKKMILSTKKHIDLLNEFDNKLFLDLDLMILASELDEYKIYAQNIRKEYAFVPKMLYKIKRKQVLNYFFNSERIFLTDFFYNKLEEKARKNIKYELYNDL